MTLPFSQPFERPCRRLLFRSVPLQLLLLQQVRQPLKRLVQLPFHLPGPGDLQAFQRLLCLCHSLRQLGLAEQFPKSGYPRRRIDNAVGAGLRDTLLQML